ncbi:MAG: LLM class flavin-dependent oxidoreductase [Streptosporangiales bacterium]|nr:LLM class flavin-dependent oxidoreductase [Streptosporangiales bacterium]
MDIGIGLPSTIPGASGGQIVEWARTAEELGFSSLGVIDRLVYGNAEPLVTLGAAATATERIKLVTSILLVPFRVNAALLAKQAATVNHLSGGRLVLGMAVGGYEDDYEASGVPFSERGRRFDQMLAEMTRIWAGESRGFAGAIGPSPGVSRSQIIFGGLGGRAYARVATWGAGWIAGSRGVESFRRGAEGVRQAWAEHGRDGRPWLMALPYFSLGPESRENADAYLTDHYAIEGSAATDIAAAALTDAKAIQDAIAEYEHAGCDELLLFPCSPDPQQVRLLADAVR